MPRVFRCPSCSMNLQIPDGYQGRDVRCSKCDTTIPINPERSAPDPGEESRASWGSSEPTQEESVRTGDPREGPPPRSSSGGHWSDDEPEPRREHPRDYERDRDRDEWDRDRRSDRDERESARHHEDEWGREGNRYRRNEYARDDYERDDYEDERSARRHERRRRVDAQEAQRYAIPPAVALLVASGLKLLMALILLPIDYIMSTRGPNPPLLDDDVLLVILLGFGFFSLVIEVFVIIGAIHLLRLSNYAWALAAAVLAMIPYWAISICFGLPVAVVSFGIGVWTLIIINQSPTREAFGTDTDSEYA